MTLRRPSLPAALAALLVAVLGAAAVAAFVLGGGDEGQAPAAAVQATATPLPPATATATPPSPTSTPEPTQAPRSTPTSSGPAAGAPAPAQPTADPSCSPSVSITASFTEAYYPVSGTTAEEINASLLANAPVLDSQKALGLTEYSLRLGGSHCVRPDSCAIGATTIRISGKVTLPKHQNPALLPAELVSGWNDFVSRVTVHEYRHVTIVKEEAELIKNQLLGLPPEATCDDMDHAIDRVWFWGMESLSRRQDVFHMADEIGQGGLVAR